MISVIRLGRFAGFRFRSIAMHTAELNISWLRFFFGMRSCPPSAELRVTLEELPNPVTCIARGKPHRCVSRSMRLSGLRLVRHSRQRPVSGQRPTDLLALFEGADSERAPGLPCQRSLPFKRAPAALRELGEEAIGGNPRNIAEQRIDLAALPRRSARRRRDRAAGRQPWHPPGAARRHHS